MLRILPCWVAVVLLALTSLGVFAKDWENLKGCRLATAEYFDGDSFHVTNDGRDLIFRLYAVDTAETSEQIPERVKAQEDYFRARKDEILAWGKRAEEFTQRLLQKPFSVETHWIDAKGASRQHRFFGKITLADGSDLGLRLVEAGLARSYGIRDGLSASYLSQLDRAEAAAKRERKGLWGGKGSEHSVDDVETDQSEPISEPDTGGIDTTAVFDSLQQEAERGPQ